MNIGIVGAGYIGGALAQAFTRHEHRVIVAKSREPRTLGAVTAKTAAVPILEGDF